MEFRNPVLNPVYTVSTRNAFWVMTQVPSFPLNFIFNTLERPPLEIHSFQLRNCSY